MATLLETEKIRALLLTNNMSLRCGLYAVNALLRYTKHAAAADAAELDTITADLHRRERAVCADGTDLDPQSVRFQQPSDPIANTTRHGGELSRGNTDTRQRPDALVCHTMYALRQRGLRCKFVDTVPGRAPRGTVGYLLATGSHYLAVVFHAGHHTWELFNNGQLVDTDPVSPGMERWTPFSPTGPPQSLCAAIDWARSVQSSASRDRVYFFGGLPPKKGNNACHRSTSACYASGSVSSMSLCGIHPHR